MTPPTAYPQAFTCPSILEVSHPSPILRQLSIMGRYREPVRKAFYRDLRVSFEGSSSFCRSSDASPGYSLEIRACFELDRMLGDGEVIGKLETSWNELLHHGNECFGE